MRVPRIYIEAALASPGRVVLDPRAARYVTQVLRLRPGQALRLFNGDGHDYTARLLECDRQHCAAGIEDRLDAPPAAGLSIGLGIGVSRGERMDYALQKSVELGVARISPLSTGRSVVQLKAERLRRRMAHWRGVVISACEQSGRATLPALDEPIDLETWLADHPGGILLHHAATLRLHDCEPPTGHIDLLVGPEGGLDAAERGRALAHGYRAVRLGPRVMRTETAPLAAIAAIQTLWGDFR
jgi:16S rRNA (uracil1498-N3)-methyltransferase